MLKLQDRRWHMTLLASVLVVSVVGLGAGFMWYRTYRERKAMRAFVETTSTMETARSEDTDEQWAGLLEVSQYGFQEYGSSQLAGYFLIYASRALLAQGKHEQACHELEKALSYLPRDTHIYYAYAIRLALMQIDADSQALTQQGNQRIQELAKDTANPLRDMALYYQGLYSYDHQDRETAQTIWWSMMETFSPETSPWAARAQAKLEYRE